MAETLTELTIEGRAAARLGARARELWAYREVVWAFTGRNNILKYKQAVFGIAWSVLQPLTFLAVFYVIFGRIARVSGGGSSYAAFAFAALVPWFFLQNSVSFGAQAVLGDSSLVRKVYFPREASVLAAVLSAGVDFAFALIVLLVLEPFLGGRVSWSVIAVIPLWLILAALGSGVAMLLGALNVYYRDFRFLLPVLLQLWMFSSPVLYPVTTVREQWRMLYLTLNPAAALLDGFRRVLSLGLWPDPRVTAIGAAGALLLLLAGYWVFKSMEPGFADAV
jgi:ABC-type polysaccharide/polyol phosphate export permease